MLWLLLPIYYYNHRYKSLVCVCVCVYTRPGWLMTRRQLLVQARCSCADDDDLLISVSPPPPPTAADNTDLLSYIIRRNYSLFTVGTCLLYYYNIIMCAVLNIIISRGYLTKPIISYIIQTFARYFIVWIKLGYGILSVKRIIILLYCTADADADGDVCSAAAAAA